MADEKKDKEQEPQNSEKSSEMAKEVQPAADTGAAGESEQESVDTVEDLKQQLDQMSDRYIRLMAEFDNFKKRVSRDYERLVESANEKLVGELIDVRETFERALRSSESVEECKGILEGMKLIYTKFDSVLSKNGLESFAEVGEVFDPQLHDALMKMPSEKIPEGAIAEIYESGYRLNGKVIKHARVIVSSGKETPEKT